MTGSSTCHSTWKHLKYPAILVLVLATLIAFGGIAQAQTRVAVHRERRSLKRRARSELGAPYRSGGTSPSGFDCSGFTHWVFSAARTDLPHSAGRQFDLAQRHGFKRVWKRSRLKVGDLVFFRTSGRSVAHAGMYVGHGRFISSTTSSGVRIDSMHDPYYWGARYVGATRTPVTIRR
jgi:cell wall-associated NlpC family hydrolase